MTELHETRVQRAIDGGWEHCYDGELIRDIAVMQADPDNITRLDGRAEMRALIKRFQAKHKRDFDTTRFKTLISAEAARLAREAELKSQIEKENRGENWRDRLIYKPSKEGNSPSVAPCEESAIIFFENHPAWQGSIAWDEFAGEHTVIAPLPIGVVPGDRLDDRHDTLMQAWLQRETNDPGWKIDTVRRAADVVAKKNSFNPIRDYLNALPPWDQVPRLPNWLVHYCGAGPAEGDDSREAQSLSAFVSAIGERWWISAIARAFLPGCKVDHVLVLEGIKGIGKTSLVDVIFAGKFAMVTGDVTSKDNQMLLSAGVWGVLMDELDVLGKSEMRAVKSWVTAQSERFRPTWGHRHVHRNRSCVFIATVNGDDWALEEDRRWWPVSCGREAFKLDDLRQDRDQLMAEALFKYNAGQRWYLHAVEDDKLIETAKREQAARVPESVNDARYMQAAHDTVGQDAGFGNSVSVAGILEKLNVPIGDQRERLSPKVGKCLKRHGWIRIRPRDERGVQVTRYQRPVGDVGPEEDPPHFFHS